MRSVQEERERMKYSQEADSDRVDKGWTRSSHTDIWWGNSTALKASWNYIDKRAKTTPELKIPAISEKWATHTEFVLKAFIFSYDAVALSSSEKSKFPHILTFPVIAEMR